MQFSAKSVTSSKSTKSSKSVGKNSTKAEKKLRNRGISGSSSKKDGMFIIEFLKLRKKPYFIKDTTTGEEE